MARFDLTNFEWSVIQPLLQNKPRGVARGRTHQRNMRHWSIDAMNVPVHLLVQRRGPDPNQVGRR